eukprot:3454654-Pyramimonas_sp.AAC.1
MPARAKLSLKWRKMRGCGASRDSAPSGRYLLRPRSRPQTLCVPQRRHAVDYAVERPKRPRPNARGPRERDSVVEGAEGHVRRPGHAQAGDGQDAEHSKPLA